MRVRRVSAGGFAAALLLAGTSHGGLAVSEVLKQFDRVCRKPFWPGFEPCRIPLAIFDGRRTWLIRHPSPPPGFLAARDRGDVRVFEGRHPVLRANTSIEIAGIWTATATLDTRSEEPRLAAALLIHETFHVFQAGRHPVWGANEADLFLYPVENPAALSLRRLESTSLRRALAAGHRAGAEAWVARAIEVRRERFALLPAAAAAYERSIESKEGVARYVETKAAGSREAVIPPAEFPAASVRDRAYASGCAMALLLDRLDPEWKGRLEEKDTLALDELLGRVAAGARPADFHAGEVGQARRLAKTDLAAWASQRETLRSEVLEAPGWKVIVQAENPVFSQNFDPLNVERLSESEVLHTRWVKLGNPSGSLEVLGRRCLTESAGKHPLFEGVRRATISGLSSEPRVEEGPEAVKISADGLTLEFRGARLTRSGQTWTVVLPRSPDH